MKKFFLHVKISTKLVVFSIFASLLALLVVGIYFSMFLEKDSLAKNKKNISEFFIHFTNDLKTQKNSLNKQMEILNKDDSLRASIYLINNYQNPNNYNASLLDEEKKLIITNLLEQAKFSFDDRILLYDKNNQLIAGINKNNSIYHTFFTSYHDKKLVFYTSIEKEPFAHFDTFITSEIKTIHDDSRFQSKPHFLEYKLGQNYLVLLLHHTLFSNDGSSSNAHIEIYKRLDDRYLLKYLYNKDIELFWSKDSKYEKFAVTPEHMKNIKILDETNHYSSALKFETTEGPIFLVFSQSKVAILDLLKKSKEDLLAILTLVIFILLISMYGVYQYTLISPLQIVMKNINRIKYRHFDRLESIQTYDELQEIARSVNELAHNVQQKEKQLKYQVEHDTLTGLHDRYFFNNLLKNAILRIRSKDEFLAIIFIDVDQFKIINDTLGHNIGDILLVEISKVLEKSLQDIGTISRIGGDEFILVLEHIVDKEYPKQIANKIKELFNKHFLIQDNYIKITASMGIAFTNDFQTSPQKLLKEADIALYKSKERGRNTYTFYEENFSTELLRKSQIITELKNAIKTCNEFYLVYQPKVNLENNKPDSLEALIRWENKNLGPVNPSEFISIAEESGIIVELGYWILQQACQDFVTLQKKGYRLNQISVNVSSIQMQQNDFIQQIQNIIQETKINPAYLELEITERYIALCTKDSICMMQKLRDFGIELAIDDFGTGYSSLSYLKQLPVTRLKVDKSFIDECHKSTEMLAIVKAIIKLAHTFGLHSTAEGVENEEQLNLLKFENCEEIQGYFFAKPMKINDLCNYLNPFYISTQKC